MIVTGNTIYNHFSHPCSYRVYLDVTGDRKLRSAPGPTGRYLMERGNRHETRIFAELKREHPDDWIEIARDPALDHAADIARRIELTEEAMRWGVRFIMHGFLSTEPGEVAAHRPGRAPEPSDFVLRGETDLLERIDDFATELGDHGYIVGDVKSSRHARFGQRMQVAFYSAILALRQGRRPERGFIVTGAGEREEFPLDDLEWTLRHFLEEEIHEYVDPERVFFHIEPSCRYCHWRDHCGEKAREENDLSLIPGCRRPEKRALIAAGIPDRAALARADEKELRLLGRAWGRSMDGYRDLKKRASAQEFGRPLVRQEPRQSEPSSRLQSPSLFRHRGPILLVDAVADPFHGDEAVLALCSFDPRDPPPLIEPRFVATREPREPEFVLRELFRELGQTNKLLRRDRQRCLLVFLDGRLPWRLKRQAADAGARHRAAPTSVEKLIAESIVLNATAERTWHLPVESRDLDGLARSLARGEATVGMRSPLELGRLEEHLRGRADAAQRADAIRGRVAALAADYGLDLDQLESAGADIDALAVREWREAESDDDDWRQLLEVVLAERLATGRDILVHLMRLLS